MFSVAGRLVKSAGVTNLKVYITAVKTLTIYFLFTTWQT